MPSVFLIETRCSSQYVIILCVIKLKISYEPPCWGLGDVIQIYVYKYIYVVVYLWNYILLNYLLYFLS